MKQRSLEVCPIQYHEIVEHSHDVWGWEIVVYLFLGGMVAGLFILFSTIALKAKNNKKDFSPHFRLMPFLALILISLGMGTLFLDLHYKLHVYRFYMAFKIASPMSWGSWILIIIYPVGFLLGLGALDNSLRKKISGHKYLQKWKLKKLFKWLLGIADLHRTTLLWTGLIMGIALGVYTGLLLGTLVARIQWNTAILGPLFLTSGISTGAAFMLLFKLNKQEKEFLVRADIVAIIIELFFIGIMLVSFMGGSETSQIAGTNLLGGKWTAPFWSLVVFMGLVFPLIMEFTEIKRKLPLVVLTPVLILLGGVALRAILLMAGQETCFCGLN